VTIPLPPEAVAAAREATGGCKGLTRSPNELIRMALEAAAPVIAETAVRDVLADLRHLCRHAELLDVERLWAELGRVVGEKYGISLELAPSAVSATEV
jgi:hypothetical protein